MKTRTGSRIAAALVLTLGVVVGSSAVSDADVGAKDRTRAAATKDSIVAQATIPLVAVFAKPGVATPKHTFTNPTENGGPRVFLVDKQRKDGWVRVFLPIRPNGSRGWVNGADVRLARTPYRVTVSYEKHTLTVYKGGKRMLRRPVGLGRKLSPTPGGKYFLTELYDVPDKAGPYGPYAFALSGFSEKLTSFNGTDAIIGIHGTNDPKGLGKDVSHGCIRLGNEAITILAGTLPLGTPVSIRA